MLFALLAVTACKKDAGAEDDLTASGTWRYKITVNVETPEGLKTGYAVREMSNSRSKNEINLPQATHPANVKGEAVVVDLGKRGKLFALMKGYKYGHDHANTILYNIFPSGSGGNSAAGIRFYRGLKEAHAVMTPEQYPMLVTFKDINDPKTVTSVLTTHREETSPFKFKVVADNFEELFGKGVKLRDITIEMTEDPVTEGIKEHMPSYGPQTGYFDWLKTLSSGDPLYISPSDFKRSK